MEKYVFLSMLRTSLLQMNVPANNIIKHVEVFEKYFSSKTPEETKKIIKNIGGLDGALEAVYKIESKRNPDILKPSDIKKNTTQNSDSSSSSDPNIVENVSFDEQNASDEVFSPDLDALEKQVTSEISIEKAIESTREIPALDGSPITEDVELIFKKRQNEKHKEMEKTTVNNVTILPEDNFELATELPPLEDEIMAYKHPSVIVELFKNLRNKMSDDVYKYTLPLTMLLKILGYALIIALFPMLAIVTAVFYVLYFACMVGGGLVSIVSLIYGIVKFSSSVAVGLYEIGIGIIIIGTTLLLCILIFIFNKKVIPLLFRKLKEIFKLWTKANKAFFRRTAKGVSA